MKKLICLLLALVSAISLISCGNEPDPNEGNYVATLKIGYYEAGYGMAFMEYWTSEYNKAHPDEMINFKIDGTIGAGSIGTALENKAGMMDVYLSLATNWSGWARAGWIEPLDDLYEMENEDGVKFKDALYEPNYGSIDGVQYVVPQSGPIGNGIVYNAIMFEEHGWIVPTTVDELFTLVDQINNDPVNTNSDTADDIAPFAWGGQVAAYWNTLVQNWANQIDGPEVIEDFYKNPSPEKYAERKGALEALKLFQRLICTGQSKPKNSIEGAMGKNHLIMQNDFVLGRAAMVSGVYGIVNETMKTIDPETCEMKIFFPHHPDAYKVNGNPVMVGAGGDFDFMFIAKDSQVKDYAKKFLLWVSTKKMANSYVENTHGGSAFRYEPSELTGLDPLTQSMVEWGQPDKLVSVSTANDDPIYQLGKITFWPCGEPYTGMVVNNMSPKDVILQQYQYVNANWATWEQDASKLDKA